MCISTKGTYKNQGMMSHTSWSTDFGLMPNLQGYGFLSEVNFKIPVIVVSKFED